MYKLYKTFNVFESMQNVMQFNFILFFSKFFSQFVSFYLPPGGDINLHHVCACVRACGRECVRVSHSFLKDYYS